MRSPSWKTHPIWGVVLGVGLTAIFIAIFEKIVSPAGASFFGTVWDVLRPLVSLIFIVGGSFFVLKLYMWAMIPTSLDIEPMDAARFAGTTMEKLRAASTKIQPPLPEVSDQNLPEQILLDFAKLEARTCELIEQGFSVQVEGLLRSNRSSVVPNYRRAFLHPSGSWAEVSQMFTYGATGVTSLPVEIFFLTYFEDNWSITDTTMKPDFLNRPKWFLRMLRTPRALSKRHDADIKIATMWQIHQERCTYIQSKLQVGQQHLKFEQYIQRRIENFKQIKTLVLRRSILWSMLQGLIPVSKKEEYWGEFHKFAKN